MSVLPEAHKPYLRDIWRQRRRNISENRRADAAAGLCEAFLGCEKVLSYASFKDELNTEMLNRALAFKGQLFLPKLIEDAIVVFKVDDIDTQLARSAWGIWEPIPTICQRANLADLALILVPGLAFDKRGHRLGYGRGHFDRFLESLPKSIRTCGIGFHEQQAPNFLPTYHKDVCLVECRFF